MNIRKLAEKNYLKFCRLDGSEYIASEFALERILRVIRKFRINSVLEIGLGIGSIADTVLKYSARNRDIKYVGTESNEFCKKVLKEYVAEYESVEHFENLTQVDRTYKFDLIIIDGIENNLAEVKNKCKKNTIIFIEGDRAPQTQLIVSLFPKAKHVNLISLKRNKPYAHGICKPTHFVGGGQLIFTDPTFKMKLYWIKEKAATFVKRRRRNFKL